MSGIRREITETNDRTNVDLRKAHAIKTEDVQRQAIGQSVEYTDDKLDAVMYAYGTVVGTPESLPTQAERITDVCDEVRDLLIRKNHDYGDSFSKQYAKYGVMSGLIRIDDKISRLDTLIGAEDDAKVAESVEDTVADLAGYALLLLVELRKGGR